MADVGGAGLAPGVRVILDGLGSAQALNGLSGTLGARQGERFKVWLRGHSTWKAIRTQNLIVEPFPPRARVVLHGLVKAAELNGRVGIVVSARATASGRYQVEVLGQGRKALLGANLRTADATEAARAPTCIGVVAPGAGLHANASFYEALQEDRDVFLKVEGSSRAAYDRYPAYWQGGSPPPNLESFAAGLIAGGCVEDHDVLVLGSRGGQVVLPEFWRECGPEVPPCFVMNGGCLMAGDKPVFWPETAATLLLIGGCDYFRGEMTCQQYIDFAKRRVPETSLSTAVLLVNEMDHMPQTALLGCVFREAARALLQWKASARPPTSHFESILSSLNRAGWSGQLSYTYDRGGSRAWHDTSIAKPGAVACPKVELPFDLRRSDGLAEARGHSCTPTAGDLRRQATVVDMSPLAVSPMGFEAPVDNQGLAVGCRVEVVYEQDWYRGTVVSTPGEDPSDDGRWGVQCDADRDGLWTYATESHIRWVSASPWPARPAPAADEAAGARVCGSDAFERAAEQQSSRFVKAALAC